MRGPDKAGPSRRNRNARPGKPRPTLAIPLPAHVQPTRDIKENMGVFSRFPSSGHAWPDPFCPCFGEGGAAFANGIVSGGGEGILHL